MKMVQCHFRRIGETPEGCTSWESTTGWVDVDEKLTVGSLVSLEGKSRPNEWWTVVSISRPIERATIRRGWKNNI